MYKKCFCGKSCFGFESVSVTRSEINGKVGSERIVVLDPKEEEVTLPYHGVGHEGVPVDEPVRLLHPQLHVHSEHQVVMVSLQ